MFMYLSNWLSLYCLRKESETITFISTSWANCLAGVDTLTDVVSGKGCGGRRERHPTARRGSWINMDHGLRRRQARQLHWYFQYYLGKLWRKTTMLLIIVVQYIIINSAVPVLRVKSVNHLLLLDDSQGILTIQMTSMVRSWPLTMKWAQILVSITRLEWFSKTLYTRIINK